MKPIIAVTSKNAFLREIRNEKEITVRFNQYTTKKFKEKYLDVHADKKDALIAMRVWLAESDPEEIVKKLAEMFRDFPLRENTCYAISHSLNIPVTFVSSLFAKEEKEAETGVPEKATTALSGGAATNQTSTTDSDAEETNREAGEIKTESEEKTDAPSNGSKECRVAPAPSIGSKEWWSVPDNWRWLKKNKYKQVFNEYDEGLFQADSKIRMQASEKYFRIGCGVAPPNEHPF